MPRAQGTPQPTEPTQREIANLRRAVRRLRAEPAEWRPVAGRGYTPARRWIVTLDDGRTVFAKVAADDLTASWIRDEHLVYSMLRDASFMPGYVGFADDGERPVLALEDLSDARWPPPWDRARIDAVLEATRLVAATPAPDGLPRVDDDHLGLRDGWDEVAADPSRALALGLFDRAWLDAHLERLRGAARAAPLAGTALLHLDVRSDNVGVRPDGRAALVDWNWTSVGNPEIDRAFWLPSLEAEGGPPPENLLPDASPELVACFAGFLVSRAARPPIPTAPNVRAVQLAQARSAVPWAARTLGLPEP
jgi:hypothetical protein